MQRQHKSNDEYFHSVSQSMSNTWIKITFNFLTTAYVVNISRSFYNYGTSENEDRQKNVGLWLQPLFKNEKSVVMPELTKYKA